MKRRDAIWRGLAAAIAAPAAILNVDKFSPIKPRPFPAPESRFDRIGIRDDLNDVMGEMIEHWSGGIRPLRVQLLRLARTGDAEKLTLIAQHPNGEWHSKNIFLSGLFDHVDPGGRTSERAYQISKRGREIARDWAYLKWGPDEWQRHVPPHAYMGRLA